MKYIATYTLNRPDGSTSVYSSMPYGTAKEAKDDLDQELHRMKDSGELEYVEKVYVYGTGTTEGVPSDVLALVKALKNTLESTSEPLSETILEDVTKEEQSNPKNLNKKLDKLYKKRMKLDKKIEATKYLIASSKSERIDSLQKHFENMKGYLGVDISRRKDIS